jgi:hypothetical protein
MVGFTRSTERLFNFFLRDQKENREFYGRIREFLGAKQGFKTDLNRRYGDELASRTYLCNDK